MFEHRCLSQEERLLLSDIRALYNEIRKLQSDVLYLSMCAGVDLSQEEENEKQT